jgi:NADH-quinone oxidoreductase subunit E
MSHKADFIAGKKGLLNGETRATIDHWTAKFPPEHKRSALIQGLLAAQEQNGGWVSKDMIEAVADYLDLPRSGPTK